MIYGITTSRAHLDPLDLALYPLDPDETPGREIDWFALLHWLWHADPTTEFAGFAGRYFLGTANEAEVAAGLGFCLWAHGEASGPDSPSRIVPLQRADPDRQEATGDQGVIRGFQDATALAGQLDRCLAVGDLEIAGTKQILAFLEVADGTRLSAEYWASWATTLHDAVLYPAREGSRSGAAQGVQPLLPAILCTFVFDGETETYLPDARVLDCLDSPGLPGFRTSCYGLWACARPGDPGLATHSFSWSTMGEVHQQRGFLGLEVFRQRVPVRYLRGFADLQWFDGPEGLPAPEGALFDTLALLTIDWSAAGDDDPLAATFTTTGWRANRRDEGGLLAELPSQLGIDTSARVSDASARCLGTTQVTVTSLSYWGSGTPVALQGPCTLAIRYYRPAGGRALNEAESLALSLNGVQIAAVFQHTADLDQGWAPYVNDLIAPFVNGEGRGDGERAFTYAADTIDQPPYTPVYFAIDFPVGHPGYTDHRPGSVPVPTPPLSTILRYFEDIHRGYRDYLAAHPWTPYYVGVYTQPETAAALYRAGLVTHFWQQPWPETPFPHLNVWQIGMDYMPRVAADNPALQACDPTPGGGFWVDLDVAWGDPGGFSVL